MDEEENKDKLWVAYRNIGLTDAENIIKSNLNGCARNFVAIGFYLKDIRDNETYLKGGYDSIWAFALDRLQMSKSTVSRFMAINDRFSVDGNSPVLMDKYLDYGSGKLQEMLTMTDEEIEKIDPDTTVKEIRKIKQGRCDAQQKNVSEADITKSSGKCIHRPEYDCILPETAKIVTLNGENCSTSCCWNCIKHGECKLECNSSAQRPEEKKPDIPTFELNGEAYGATRSTIIESLVTEMVDTDTAIEDIDGDYCPAFGKDYYAYSSNINRYINIEDDNNNVVFRTSFERFQGEYEWHKARLATLSSEEPEDDEEPESVNNTPEKVTEIVESVIKGPKSDNPLSCKHDSEARCLIASKDSCVCKESESCMYYSYGLEDEEPIEIIEADIIQSEPTEPTELPNPLHSAEYHLKEAIRQEEEQIEIMQDHWKVHQPDTFLKHQTILRALKCFLSDMEYPDPETEEMEQPEFPKLKNNDQRKEWIDNYETWPVWIDIPQTGERYYRYDFDNGTSFVIRVSLQHAYKGYERTKEIKYAHEEYFLLGVKDKWIPGIPTFVESSTNKSAMVEHLKEIQKKGAS
jgi:hypothetical protein